MKPFSAHRNSPGKNLAYVTLQVLLILFIMFSVCKHGPSLPPTKNVNNTMVSKHEIIYYG